MARASIPEDLTRREKILQSGEHYVVGGVQNVHRELGEFKDRDALSRNFLDLSTVEGGGGVHLGAGGSRPEGLPFGAAGMRSRCEKTKCVKTQLENTKKTGMRKGFVVSIGKAGLGCGEKKK